MLEDTLLMKELHDSGTPLTESSILRFEGEIGHELPHGYRQFLLLRNGGRFYRDMACRMQDQRWNEYAGQFKLYMLDDEFVHEAGDIRYARKCLEGAIPKRMLSIGGVAGGALMVDLHGGGVYVWVQDYAGDSISPEVPAEQNAFLAAPSFEAFAERLEYDPRAHFHWSQEEPPFTFIERYENDKLEAYLTAGGTLDVYDIFGCSPLIAAAHNLDAIKLLLVHGADLNAPYDKWKMTLFENAATGNMLDLVRFLLPYNPSLLCGDGSGRRLLDLGLHPRIRRLLETAEREGRGTG